MKTRVQPQEIEAAPFSFYLLLVVIEVFPNRRSHFSVHNTVRKIRSRSPDL